MFSEGRSATKDNILEVKKLPQKIHTQEFNNNNISRSNPLVSLLEEGTLKLNQPTGRSPENDMPCTLDIFRKSLHDKAHQFMGHASAEEHEAARSKPKFNRRFSPLHGDACLSRRPSFLEQGFLPGTRQSILPSNNSSTKGQLTIFYCGAVNVYENVPADKAQAIMLLAGQSSLQDPASPMTPTSNAIPESSNLPPISDMQAGLPIARKASLRRFLGNRRKRIATGFPYAFGTQKPDLD